jgi:hypothetical protein
MQPFKIVYLDAGQPLRKTIRPNDVIPYPTLKNKTSHEDMVFDLPQWLASLKTQAAAGMCLYKGLLDRPLVNESRAGHTAHGPTRWVMIDIDGLPGPVNAAPLNAADLLAQAQHVLAAMPDVFRNTSCIAHASSKNGMRGDQIALHLFFVLDEAMPVTALKSYLTFLNFDMPVFKDALSLTTTGWALKYKLDICVADNAREIFIAPAAFVGVDDPFPNPDDRFILITATNECLPVAELTVPEDLERIKSRLVNKLMKDSGQDHGKKAQFKSVFINNERVDLLLNPLQGKLIPYRETGDFCSYNMGDGDSNAYFHRRGYPDIIYNFKGEPPFRWVDFDPEGYHTYCLANRVLIDECNPVSQFMVLDLEDGSTKRIHWDKTSDAVAIRRDIPANKDAFYAQCGEIAPENLEYWDIHFDPQQNGGINIHEKRINTFKPTHYMAAPAPLENEVRAQLVYGNAEHIKQLVPNIWALMDHVFCGGIVEINHFINWLAFIAQRRDKTGTAWILQGIQGTGKGTLVDCVLRPLLGEEYTQSVLSKNLKDSFTGWRINKLLVVIDEIDSSQIRKEGGLYAQLKNWITEPLGTVRKMRMEAFQMRMFDNYILCSNKYDILEIEESDRRYNVAARQELALAAVLPNVVTYMHNDPSEELALFNSVLHHWVINETAVRVPLKNEAKQLAKAAAGTNLDDFVTSLRAGDLGYFATIMDDDASSPNELSELMLVKKYIGRWVAHAGKPDCIPTGELTKVWNYIGKQNSSTKMMGKTLQRRGFQSASDREIERATGERGRGVNVHFRLDSISDKELDHIRKNNVLQFPTGQAQ